MSIVNYEIYQLRKGNQNSLRRREPAGTRRGISDESSAIQGGGKSRGGRLVWNDRMAPVLADREMAIIYLRVRGSLG